MISITSNDINIADAGIIDDAHVIEMTPLVLPAPVGDWYKTPNITAFSDLQWNAATNRYEVVTQNVFRAQLELH